MKRSTTKTAREVFVVLATIGITVLGAGAATGCVTGSDPEASGHDAAGTDTGTTPGTDTASPFDTNPLSFDTGTPPPPTDTGTPPPPVDTGTPPPTDTGGPCTTSVIDDMETAGGIKKVCGRQGFWYTYNDATVGGTQLPSAGSAFAYEAIVGGRGTSVMAAHTSGSGFTTWGAGMAFDVNDAGGASKKAPYNASAYKGITFFAKATTTLSVRVNVSTSPTEEGFGTCVTGKCSDHFGKTITLSTTWTAFTLDFSTLTQLGWGTPAGSFDASKVIAVQFQVDKSTAFDFWVDDAAFTP